jgi:hypothetical protein
MAVKKAIWISYDLGLKGDYAGLYTLLDSLEARECGNSLAFYQKEYRGDLKEAVKAEIEQNVKLSKSDRIYITYLDDETGKIKGSFIIGGRKRAPWEGYSVGTQNVEEDSV